MTQAISETIARIDEQIRAKHLLNHPFYQAWTRGELTVETLRDYAAQYYKHVAAFPTYLSAVHARCEDQDVRRELAKNLFEEEGTQPTHPELWLQFAEGLGMSRDEVRNAPAAPETSALIEAFRKVCGTRPVTEGVAALYAYESQIPEVSESKIAGLCEHYGFAENDPRHKYFAVHIEADREHSAAERRMLQGLLAEDGAEAEQSVDHVLNALWEMLSGVCRRNNLPLDCAH